jgi:hypothetical protein
MISARHTTDMSTVDSVAPSIDQQTSTLVDSAELPPSAQSPPKKAFEHPSKQVTIEEPAPPPTRLKREAEAETRLKREAEAETGSNAAEGTPKSADASSASSGMAGRARSGSQRMQALSQKFSK